MHNHITRDFMKFLVVVMLFAFTQVSLGSPQQPELLILEGDTISIYHLPLNDYLSGQKNSILYDLQSQGQILSATSNWRGYQGIWSIENDRLYFLGFHRLFVSDAELTNSDIVDRLFGEKFENGKVHANWYSSTIIVPKGDFLRWDGIFARTYVKEEILSFNRGVLVKREVVENYISRPNAIARYSKNNIHEILFEKVQELNWGELYQMECDYDYTVTINKSGRISKVEFTDPLFDSMWEDIRYWYEQNRCKRAIKKVLRPLQFDIIKWHGKPYEETIGLSLHYNATTKELENLNDWEKVN